MEEQLIEFETAKLAKEKGFEAETHYGYDIHQKTPSVSGVRYCDHWQVKPVNHNSKNDSDYRYICAPTQGLLHKWLREVHNINIVIFSDESFEEWSYMVDKFDIMPDDPEWGYPSYEHALEQGLIKALNYVN